MYCPATRSRQAERDRPPEGSEHDPHSRPCFPTALSAVAALALSFGGAVGAFVLTAGPAAADTINVTNTADDGSATSLRGVLESVNDGDVVVLTAGATYQLTICEEPIDIRSRSRARRAGATSRSTVRSPSSATAPRSSRRAKTACSTRRTRSPSRTSPSPVASPRTRAAVSSRTPRPGHAHRRHLHREREQLRRRRRRHLRRRHGDRFHLLRQPRQRRER